MAAQRFPPPFPWIPDGLPCLMNDESQPLRAMGEPASPPPAGHSRPHGGAAPNRSPCCERLQARLHELQIENERLRRLAITDELTGTYNRRYFSERLHAVLVDRPRTGALALCLFDIDNFKDINDAHGHYAGDGVLRAVALVAQEKLQRADDCLFRLGGDEFAAIYSALSPSQALEHAQQILDAVRGLKRSHCASMPGIVTASLGVVWLDAHSELSGEQVYAAADRALYRAKQAGRNQISVAHWQ